MPELSPDRFAEFVGELWNRDPFPWQERVAKRVASGEQWPPGIALPTATGKTSCIDIAVFALACQADLAPESRNAPRRIFFVIDRRVVVDEAYEHAQRLSEKLNSANEGVVFDVAERLRDLSGDLPLTVHRMRGGTLRDVSWARNPAQCSLIVSTVDQLGSRLLFRGYGVTDRMAPVHAALCGNDSLVLLDEAHTSRPFSKTLRAVSVFRRWAEENVGGPFQTVLLSATLPDELRASAEGLTSDDLAHPVLSARLGSAKPAKLVISKQARGDEALEKFAVDVAKEVGGLIKSGRRSLGVIVNRVRTASLVERELRAKGEFDVLLMTGRMRPIDRDELLVDWHEQIERLERGGQGDWPVVLVATQCIEVGANFDFDALVTECASLDALRQRFGRVDRFAERHPDRGSESRILVQASQKSKSDDDPVYGSSLAETWKWLESISEKAVVDFGVAAIQSILPDDADQLSAPSTDAPTLLPAHLDFLSQTNPRPVPEPDPALFLHGIDRGAPEVQICWRIDLDPDFEDEWRKIVELCPPTTGECVSVPIWAARKWLRDPRSEINDLADVEGVRVPDEKWTRASGAAKGIRWRSPRDRDHVRRPDDLQPGDTLVLPAWSRERLSREETEVRWGALAQFRGRDGHVEIDLAERSFLAARDRAVLRLIPDTIDLHFAEVDTTSLKTLLGHGAELTEELKSRILKEVAVYGPRAVNDEVQTICEHLTSIVSTDVEVIEHPSRKGYVLRGRRRVKEQIQAMAEEVATETEEIDTSFGGELTLSTHLADVRDRARELAVHCGASKEQAEMISLAGWLHDLGKADTRFQALLHRGQPLLALMRDEPLAKSPDAPLTGRSAQHARRRVNLPDGFRHELVSVRMIESNPELLDRAGSDLELVLHLVESHHGYCRPLAPVISEQNPIDVEYALEDLSFSTRSDTELDRLDSGVADRFWRLTRRFGWWGLAWLESLMRLADHLESERREQQTVENRRKGIA